MSSPQVTTADSHPAAEVAPLVRSAPLERSSLPKEHSDRGAVIDQHHPWRLQSSAEIGPVRLDRAARRRLAALERRAAFLGRRIANYRADGNPSRDLAERGALLWAIETITYRRKAASNCSAD
jgi:hypothetical protein